MNSTICFVYIWTSLCFLLPVDGNFYYFEDIPLQSTYVTKYIEKCPEQGYFFKRDLQGAYADTCYLCFCKGNSSAICWQRNNKKCDEESYQHNWAKKRVSRNRRSPISFGDLFMRDATKAVFNAQDKTSCKPNEASYSEGCPPLDWCVGCTVCDCNTNGKWDCHLLSFCTNDGKKNKNKNKNYKGELQGKFYDPFTTPRTRRAERQKNQRAVKDLAEKMAQARQKKKIGKSNTRRYFFKNGTLVNKTIFDLRKRKKSPTILNQTSAELLKWSNLNMKIRKIPDQITRQILIDKQQSNAKKVSESANFFVRKMPNKKSKKIIDQKHSQAVNVLAKRQPNRKKKRQVILPSGFKLPKELLDKLPPGVIPPTRDPPGDHFPKKSHVKRVLPNQMAATKPPRQTTVKRSLELLSDVMNKKIVKRSTKFEDKKTKRKEKNAHRHKSLPVAKPAGKGPNLFQKKMTGLKENSKKKSLKVNNLKIIKKSKSKNNNHVDNKNNQQKNSGRKNSKDKTKTKEKNKSVNKNVHKNKKIVKNIPNNLRKSLKSNGNQNQNHHNDRRNKTSKNNPIKNEGTKKSPKHNSGVNVKNEIKNKKRNIDNHIKNNDIAKNKSKTTKKPIKKEMNKTPNDIINKKSVKASYTRGKRSDPESWVKTVTEGNKVTKYSFKREAGENKKKSKISSPKETVEEIHRRKLNEAVKKITGNIERDLNRKVFEAVGKMIGQNLTQQSKKVKRSAVLETEAIHENESDEVNDGVIDFMTPKPNKFNQKQSLDMTDVAEEKHSLSLPFLEYSGQRVKRSPYDDEGYNESRHIPFIVKKRPLPPIKHIEKREIHLNPIEEQFTSSTRPGNQTMKAFEELDKYLEAVTLTTPDYLTTDMKRSVPLSKQETTGNSDLIDIHVPIKRTSRNIVNNDYGTANSVPTKNYRVGLESKNLPKLTMVVSPFNKFKRSAPVKEKVMTLKIKQNVRPIKKSQKVHVDKFNQVKVYRHKRSADIEQPVTENLQHFENEVLTNSSHDIRNLTSQNKFEATDSIYKYYKYSVDDYLDANTEQAVENYLTEVVEVYTKNMAAKRSVDKQIERLPNMDVDQIKHSDSYNENVTVRGLADNNKEYTIMVPQLIENKTVSSDDEKFKVHAGEPHSFKSTNVLDDKVVIIQEQNVSSIEQISELTTYPLPNPTVSTATEPRLINKTVIGIKFQENQLTKNTIKNDTFHMVIPSESIDKSSTLVDKSVVIIHDQNGTIMPTSSYLSATTKYKMESKMGDTTDSLISKEPLLIKATEGTKITSSKKGNLEQLLKPTTITSLKVIDKPVHVAENPTEKKIQSTDVVKDDSYLVIKENEFKHQMTTKILNEDRNKYLLKLTTESYIKSEFGIDNNVTKQDMSVIDIGSKESEVISPKVTATTEQIKLSTFRPILKNYLKYDVETKTNDLKQNLIKLRKYNKLLNQENMTINSTEKSKSKYRNDAILVQKGPHTKTQENHTEANNDTAFTTDLRIRNYNILPTTKSNIIKQDHWVANSTFEPTEHDFTTKFSADIYSTKVLSLLQDQIHKNLTKTNAEINIVKNYDMKKISVKKAKKNRLKKILSTLHNRPNKDERYLIDDIVKHQKNINKTNDLKSFFKKLLSNFKFNKHVRKPSNVKRFKILKYLQKFFKKIFSDDGKHKKNKTLAHQLNRKNIIDTLCSSFGPCNINVKNKAKLQSQIDHLNSETYKMLRSVKIIKGLLKLVDMAGNDKKLSNGTSLKANFKSDVQKLHAILRDTYSNSGQMDTLTDTQKIQIQYIRNSTQNFIQSAAKFTMVLNEIINMITLSDHKRINYDNHKPKVERIKKPDITKIFKSRYINQTETATESNESLQKLKELISKYSLIQNTFMRKIYNVLTNLDSRKGTQKKNRAIDATINKKFQQHQNKTEEIQVYTKNIIQNLRKLKNLAQNLNGDTEMGHVRRKRDLRNDDSLEYMLMLMEYLIKQQHPLDDAPVSDGIDLLIDAIKSAPDIKTIKKKVLPMYSHPTKNIFNAKNIFKANNMSKSSESLEEKGAKDVSSESDSEPSKEVNVTSSKLEDAKFNVIDQSIDDDGDEQDYYIYNRRANLPTTVQVPTSTEYHTKAKWHEHVTTDSYYNTISDTDVSTKSKSRGNNHNHANKVTKFDFFNRYIDEDVQTTVTASELDYTPASEASTKIDMTTKSIETTPLVKMRHNNNDDVSASKSRIDWLDETYEEEIKESHRTNPPPVKAVKHTQLKQVIKDTENCNLTTESKKSVDISGLSKEEETQPNNSTTSSKDIFHKKEMGLLNSLDYGTEKTELDVSASRESGAIDKYTGEAFSTYFREERI